MEQSCADRLDSLWLGAAEVDEVLTLEQTAEVLRAARGKSPQQLQQAIELDLYHRREAYTERGGGLDGAQGLASYDPRPEDYERHLPEYGPVIRQAFRGYWSAFGGDTPPPAPARVGYAYHWRKRLGQGSFGHVHRYEDTISGLSVAVKFPTWAEDGLAVGESRAMARVGRDQPNLVPLLHVIRDDVTPFALVSAFVEGPTLEDERFVRPRIAPSSSARIVRLLATAVGTLHGPRWAPANTTGQDPPPALIHQDIKPANVLMEDLGTNPSADSQRSAVRIGDRWYRPRLTDFGLSAVAGPDGNSPVVGGSAGYMAPEQRLECARVRPAADVWSLGAVLHQLLLGRVPDVQQEWTGGRIRGELMKVRVPAAIAEVCVRALHPDPQGRIRDGDELATALDRALSRPARRRLAAVLVGVLGVFVLMAWLAVDWIASGMVEDVAKARTADVPGKVGALQPLAWWAKPKVADAYRRAGHDPDRKVNLGIALARLDPADPEPVDYMAERLLDANPSDVTVLANAVVSHRDRAAGRWWRAVAAPERGGQVPRAVAALCTLDPEGEGWATGWAKGCAEELIVEVSASPKDLSAWCELLRPRADSLGRELESVYGGNQRDTAARRNALRLLVEWADTPEQVVMYLKTAEDDQFEAAAARLDRMGDREMVRSALRRAYRDLPRPTDGRAECNLIVARLRAGDPDAAATARSLLGNQAGVDARFALIPGLPVRGVSGDTLADWLDDPNARYAIILAVGRLDEVRLSPADRRRLAPRLAGLSTDDDPGVRSASLWLLGRWDARGDLDGLFDGGCAAEAQRRLTAAGGGGYTDRPTGRRWYVTAVGRTMAVVPGPVVSSIGSPDGEPGRDAYEFLKTVTLPRSFAVSATEFTWGDYRKLVGERGGVKPPRGDTENHPVRSISRKDTMILCNALSLEEGLPLWYRPEDLKDDDPLPRPAADDPRYAEDGYRLPTEAEWEYCCRAGTNTPWFFGGREEWLGGYALYAGNSRGHPRPVGAYPPNPLGLFDVHGNVAERCENHTNAFVPLKWDGQGKVPPFPVRGGSYRDMGVHVRSATRYLYPSGELDESVGLRVVRTLPRTDPR